GLPRRPPADPATQLLRGDDRRGRRVWCWNRRASGGALRRPSTGNERGRYRTRAGPPTRRELSRRSDGHRLPRGAGGWWPGFRGDDLDEPSAATRDCGMARGTPRSAVADPCLWGGARPARSVPGQHWVTGSRVTRASREGRELGTRSGRRPTRLPHKLDNPVFLEQSVPFVELPRT